MYQSAETYPYPCKWVGLPLYLSGWNTFSLLLVGTRCEDSFGIAGLVGRVIDHWSLSHAWLVFASSLYHLPWTRLGKPGDSSQGRLASEGVAELCGLSLQLSPKWGISLQMGVSFGVAGSSFRVTGN